jgi:hypothetical protein
MDGLMRGRGGKEPDTHNIFVSPYDLAASRHSTALRQHQCKLIWQFGCSFDAKLCPGSGRIKHRASTQNRSVAVENYAELLHMSARVFTILDTHFRKLG